MFATVIIPEHLQPELGRPLHVSACSGAWMVALRWGIVKSKVVSKLIEQRAFGVNINNTRLAIHFH